MLRCLASCTKRCAQPRTCTTEPGAEPRAGSATAWMLSMTSNSGCTLSSAATMLVSDGSDSNHKLSFSACRRSARKRTCCALSSAVTYNDLVFHAASSCNNSVDLPMPGSPPSSVTEPGTRPPSSTRSISEMPVGMGWPMLASSLLMGCAVPGGMSAMPAASVETSFGSSTSSTRVFHAPHESHLPAHL